MEKYTEVTGCDHLNGPRRDHPIWPHVALSIGGVHRSMTVGWSLGPMAKRSKVELFEEIRKAESGKDSPSVRELSRRFGVHRRMVRQALDSALPPPRKLTQKGPLRRSDPGRTPSTGGWPTTRPCPGSNDTPHGGSSSAWSKSTTPR